MKKLPIGQVIYKLRKEKEITQEQLGNFIGVSTAAVSKWESGISYPDITLLPILATFFNVSIDQLLNFKIELSDDEVMEIFSECERAFHSGDLEQAIERSKNYLLKYPGSYYLKLRIGFLFHLYSFKGNDEDQSMHMVGDAIECLEDVAQNCNHLELVESALFQLGVLYSSIGEDDKAIETLNKINKSQYDPNDILTHIYIQRNEQKKARELLQSKLYKSINDISLVCLGLANSYMSREKELDQAERYIQLSLEVKKAFSPEGDSILSLWNEYFYLAEIYLGVQRDKEAIVLLNKGIEDIRKNDINQPIHLSSVWCFNEIPDAKPTMTINLYENVFNRFEKPLFNQIRDTEEFVNILNELRMLEMKSLDRTKEMGKA